MKKMKTLLSLLCLVAAVCAQAEDAFPYGTDVSADPAVRIKAIKQKNFPYECYIYPEVTKAFEDEIVERVEIIVSFAVPGSGYMSTSRKYLRSSDEAEVIHVSFSETSMKNVSVAIHYWSSFRMVEKSTQSLGELCEGRDLPFSF